MGTDLELWDTLIGNLYEGVLSPQSLHRAMSAIDHALGSDGCHFFGLDKLGNNPFEVVSNPGLLGMMDAYHGYYRKVDPRVAFVASSPVGVAYQCSDLFNERYVSGSEFYQDFFIPGGGRYVAGGCVSRGQDQTAFVAFNRLLGRKPFNADEMVLIQRLLPHLGRVAAMLKQNRAVASAASAGEAALESLLCGVIVLNELGEAVFVNASAEGLLREMTDELRRKSLVTGASLGCAFERVKMSGVAQSVRLRLKKTDAAYIATLLPYPQREVGLERLGARERLDVLLLLRPQDRSPTSSAEKFISLFGLTVAEGRLAEGLSFGLSLDDYCTKHGLRITTARTQVRALLEKTGASRLQDLIRLLSSMH